MSGEERFSLRFALKKAVKDRIYGPPPGLPPESTPPLPVTPGPSPTAQPVVSSDVSSPQPPTSAVESAPEAGTHSASMLAPLRLLTPCEDAVHAARIIESVAAVVPQARFSARVPGNGVGRRYLFTEIPGGRGAREALAAAAEAVREAGGAALLGFADGYRPGDPGTASSESPPPAAERVRISAHPQEEGGEVGGEDLLLEGWPLQGIRDLVGALPLLENHLHSPSSRAYVRVPAVLLRGTVIRLSRARVTCRAAALTVERFSRTPHLRDQVLVAVEDEGGSPLPDHLLEALARLAGAAVYIPSEAGGGARFLVERGYMLPISGTTIASLVAESEIHLFGGPGSGHLVLDQAPDYRPVPLPASGQDSGTPVRAEVGPPPGLARISVRLVPRPPGPAPAEALILTEQELTWLKKLLPHLPGRWLDRMQLIRAEGASLLLCDGPLPSTIPFGTPLRRRDPPTLLVEAHHDLDPDLDSNSLRVVASLPDDAIEAWLPQRRLRFPLAAVRPVVDLLQVDPSLVPEEMRPLDEGFTWKLEKATQQGGEVRDDKAVDTPGGISVDGRRALLGDIARLSAAGQFAEAAAICERLGDFAKAARLYEKAAEDEEKRKAKRRG